LSKENISVQTAITPGVPAEGLADAAAPPGDAQQPPAELSSKGVIELPISDKERAAFAAHVADVKKHGDALNVPMYRNRWLGASSVFGPALTTMLVEMAVNGPDTPGLFTLFATEAVAGAATFGAYRFHRMPRSDRLLSRDAQEATSEQYNLFASRKISSTPRHVGMRYYGPFEPRADEPLAVRSAGILAHIQKVARLAQEQGVSEIVLPAHWAKTIGITGFKTTNNEAFMKDYGLALTADTSEELASMSPQQWLNPRVERVRNIDHDKELLPLARLEKIVKTLKAVRPNHPLVQAHAKYAPSKIPQSKLIQKAMLADLKSKLVPVLSAALERDLSDLEHYRPGKLDMAIYDVSPVRQVTYRPAGLPPEELPPEEHGMQQPSDASVAPAKATGGLVVTWHNKNGTMAESAGVQQAMGMDAEHIDELLAVPARNPDAMAKLATLLIVDALRNEKPSIDLKFFKDTTLTEVIEQGEIIDPALQYANRKEGLQEAMLPAMKFQGGRRKDTVRRRIDWERIPSGSLMRRGGRGLGAALAVAGVVFGLAAEADASYNHATATAAQEIANAQGVDVSTVPQDDARHLAEANSFSLQAIGVGVRAAEQLHQTFSFNFGSGGSGGSGSHAASMTNLSKVGNAGTDGPAHDDWHLKTEGNISAAGFWTIGTASSLRHDKDGLSWEMYENIDGSLPLPTHPAIPRATITVSRNLSSTDYTQYGGDWLVPVPELEGTTLEAADFDGHNVSMATKNDGTAMLDVGKTIPDGPHKLEYFLQNGTYPITVRAISSLTEENKSVSLDLYHDLQRIRQDWETRIPNFAMMDTYAKAHAVAAYIQQHFDYRVNPFDKDTTIDGTKPSTFVEKELDIEKANCNAASTLDALSVMDTDAYREPNIDVGYQHNAKGTVGALNTHELHQKLVFPSGATLDATPYKGVTAADEAYLDPHQVTPHPEQLPIDPLDAGIGIAAVAVAMSQRRRIMAGARQIVQWGGEKARAQNDSIMDHAFDALEGTDERDIFVVREVANALQFDPDQNVGAAIARGQNTPPSGYDPSFVSDDHEEAQKNLDKNPLNILTQSHLQGVYVEAVLRAGIAVATDPDERAVLERSLAIVVEAWNLQFAGNSAIKYLATRIPGYRRYQQNRSK